MNFSLSSYFGSGTNLQNILIAIMFFAYVWLVSIDIKHREMWFLQEFAVGVFNVVVAFVFASKRQDNKLLMPLVVATISWLIIVLLNGMFNTEGEEGKDPSIGSADIDLFALQFCLSSIIIFFIAMNTEKMVRAIHVMRALEMMFSSLVAGLVITVAIWCLRLSILFIFCNKEKKKLKTIFKENKNVAAISAVVPLAITNILLIINI